jgi:hypothetical protein
VVIEATIGAKRIEAMIDYRHALHDFLSATADELRHYADSLDGKGPAWPDEIAALLRLTANQFCRIAEDSVSAETLVFLAESARSDWAETHEDDDE